MKIQLISLLLFCSILSNAQNIKLYVGTYTGETSEGIYSYEFNTNTGDLSNKKLAVKAINPSFIAFSSNKKFIYSVSAVANFEQTKSGYISSYSVHKNGSLHFLNKVSTNGANPCHISINRKGDKAVVSNYTGGSLSIHSILKNNEIANSNQVIDHHKYSELSHVHSAKFLKNSLFVADLGLNTFSNYSFNNYTNKYQLNTLYKIEDNAGPRHFEISRKGKFIYIINELNSTISVLKKQPKNYSFVQNINTLEDNFEGKSYCADIHLSENEDYLYASNRGENTIAVFKIAKKNGELRKIQTISTFGNWPRNFTISPKGRFLLVANQKSNQISVYSIHKSSGKLTYLHSTNAPSPVCLIF